MVRLGPRLKTVVSFVEKGASVIDIGCDHGYVPIYLVQNGICRHVTATDIRYGPLNSAIRSAEENGVSEKIDFILTDGLKNVPRDDADTIVISGMGGETMIGILEGEDWLISEDVKLILQPQSKTDELLLWLERSGFAIRDVSLAREDGILYLVLKAQGAENGDAPIIDVLMLLKEKEDPLFEEYIDYQTAKFEKILEGMNKSEHARYETEKVKEKLEMYMNLREETDYGNGRKDL